MPEIFYRRRLPHWQPPGASYFVTYRLVGTIPYTILEQLRQERERLLSQPNKANFSARDWQIQVDKKIFALWDNYLDNHVNIRWLAVPGVANMIHKSFYYYAGDKYHLRAYAIMPNHVHILISPIEDSIAILQQAPNDKTKKGLLSPIMHSLKSYTANQANKILERNGQFWQHESYDHWVRDEEEFCRIVYYIENNPVKAGLAIRPEDWLYSSAHDRIQRGFGPYDHLV